MCTVKKTTFARNEVRIEFVWEVICHICHDARGQIAAFLYRNLRVCGEEKKASAQSTGFFLCLVGAGVLFVEKLAEHRVDIFLIADMLDCEIIKHRLQMFIFAPQRLVRAACYLDIAIVTHNGQNFLRQNFMT